MKPNKFFITLMLILISAINVQALDVCSEDFSAVIALKNPGNKSKQYPLTFQESANGMFICQNTSNMPLTISRKIVKSPEKQRIFIKINALKDIYFNYGEQIKTHFKHSDCMFYMPGFWYRHNMRSPKEAPSFHTSDSWIVREDRLSTPLTAAFNTRNGKSISVIRIDPFEKETVTTHNEGEVILSGETSIGYTGFMNTEGNTVLAYGFPYKEQPKTYIRKLTLAPPVKTFLFLKKGDSISLTWEISERKSSDFSEFVQQIWEYSYDTNNPAPVHTPYTKSQMKKVLSNFFEESYVKEHPLHYFSGVGLETSTCKNTGIAEVGFVGRTLLNAFNALEYGYQTSNQNLVTKSNNIFNSYHQFGLLPSGFFKEVIDYNYPSNLEQLSIRRQSEGVYAVLNYLFYEKEHKRQHPEWEQCIKNILERFLSLQKTDGSFPRKFNEASSIIDASGGSTPSATLPLVLAYKYFKDKRYLESAKRTVNYLEKELIDKADYFSSTLDANCEDKESSLYASTAAYYLALITKGEEHAHYSELSKKAAYFALSWYYTWDVPFAQGQMLGDIGFKTRGWGNVSVENNHIDVFVFDFSDVLNWLSKEFNEPRFSSFSKVISTSMRQLLPHKEHMCNIAKEGYYPEVVQHTNWDYGRNGKGFYNNIFAPGWTIASLWELFTPGRAEHILLTKD